MTKSFAERHEKDLISVSESELTGTQESVPGTARNKAQSLLLLFSGGSVYQW